MVKKMSNQEVIVRVNGITKILERAKSENVFGIKKKAFYAAIMNREKMSEVLKPYNEVLQTLMKECEVQEVERNNEKFLEPKEEHRKKWFESIGELQSIKVDVPIFEIKIDDIADADLTQHEFEIISFMISDPE